MTYIIKNFNLIVLVVFIFCLMNSCISKSELSGLRGTYKGTCIITQESVDPATGELVTSEELLEGASIEILRFAEEGSGDGVVECESGCGSTSEYPYFRNELYQGDTILIVHQPEANQEFRLMMFKGEDRLIVESSQRFPTGIGGVFFYGEYFKE